MGKYQLDDKGQRQVARFHEKQSSSKANKPKQLTDLKAQFAAKTIKKG